MNHEIIRKKRENLDLTRKEFSDWLGLDNKGQKLLKLWEEGKEAVPQSFLKRIESIPTSAPFAQSDKSKYKFKFIDLFAGIGGIRLPFQNLKGHCVFSSE